MDLTHQIVSWIVHASTLDHLAEAVLIGLALRVALQNVIARSIDAAAGEALEVVVAHVQLGLVPVQARARVHARVGRAAEGR